MSSRGPGFVKQAARKTAEGRGPQEGEAASAVRAPLPRTLLWPGPPWVPSPALFGGSYLLPARWTWLASVRCPWAVGRSLRTGARKSSLTLQQKVGRGRHEWVMEKTTGAGPSREGPGLWGDRMLAHNPRFSGSEPGVPPLGRGSRCHQPDFTSGSWEGLMRSPFKSTAQGILDENHDLWSVGAGEPLR